MQVREATAGDPPGVGRGWRRIPWSLRMLAVVQLLIGAGIGLFAVAPPSSSTPRAVEAAGATAAVLLAAASLLVLARLPRWVTTASVCLTALLLSMLTAVMPTPQGQVLASLGLVMICVFSAQHLTGVELGVVLAVGVGSYLGALRANPQIPGAPVYAVAIMLVIAGVTLQVARLETRLRFQALHDPLTGALNRNGLAERAPGMRDLAARAGRPTAVVVLDLDLFKAYNDTHGHAAADAALAALVAGWLPLLRSSDLVGRIGGDEFALVLPGSSREASLTVLARLEAASALPWTCGTDEWSSDEGLFEAFARADTQLYEAKRARPDVSRRGGPGSQPG